MSEKMWGSEPFWGLGYDWDRTGSHRPAAGAPRDADRALREGDAREREALRRRATTSRAATSSCSGSTEFFGLHRAPGRTADWRRAVAFSMTCETIARYGCASAAMCYVMHIGAVQAIMLRPTAELVDKYIRPLSSGLIRTLSYSDPETGSHFWYAVSSKAGRSNGGYRVTKKASWTAIGGFADLRRPDDEAPDFKGYDDLSVFVIDKEHCEAQPSLWDALGLRGNQSGAIAFNDVEIPGAQIVGPEGDGATSNDEAVDPWFLIGSSSVWNGLALGTIDIARRHRPARSTSMSACASPTTRRSRTTSDRRSWRRTPRGSSCCRSRRRSTARRRTTPSSSSRASSRAATLLHWAWQIKFVAAQNAATGRRQDAPRLRRLGLQAGHGARRYVRDVKAGWVMGPTNEVLRQFVGKAVLLGFESLDYWNQSYNRRAVENEVKKLDAAGKRELAEQLVAEAEAQEAKEPAKA